jgi:hypothetical protein
VSGGGARVGAGLLSVTLFAALLGIATVLHWDRFNHGHLAFRHLFRDRPLTWLLLVGLVSTVVASVLLWRAMAGLERANGKGVLPDDGRRPAR